MELSYHVNVLEVSFEHQCAYKCYDVIFLSFEDLKMCLCLGVAYFSSYFKLAGE